MALWKLRSGKGRWTRFSSYYPQVEVLETRILLSFITAGSYPVGKTAEGIAVGDFNGDGIPDVVTANVNSSSVSVLLGNGDGSFQAAVDHAISNNSYPDAVAVGILMATGFPTSSRGPAARAA